MGLSSSGLDAFLVCAREGNFTRASESLNITQSALSQRIKNLENELGATLFIRDRLGVRLTEQGESLLRYCATREQMEQEVVSEISGAGHQVRGVLKVGGFSSVVRSVVIPTCSEVFQRHPQVKVNVLSKELFELGDLLRAAVIDFALMDQAIEREHYKSVLLGYELNVRARKKGTQFSGRYLDHDERDETTRRYLKLKPGVKIERHYLDDIYGIIDGVQMGLGDAIIPRHLLAGKSGIEVINPETVLRSPVYLNFYDQAVPTKLNSVFLEALIQWSRKILDPRDR